MKFTCSLMEAAESTCQDIHGLPSSMTRTIPIVIQARLTSPGPVTNQGLAGTGVAPLPVQSSQGIWHGGGPQVPPRNINWTLNMLATPTVPRSPFSHTHRARLGCQERRPAGILARARAATMRRPTWREMHRRRGVSNYQQCFNAQTGNCGLSGYPFGGSAAGNALLT